MSGAMVCFMQCWDCKNPECPNLYDKVREAKKAAGFEEWSAIGYQAYLQEQAESKNANH